MSKQSLEIAFVQSHAALLTFSANINTKAAQNKAAFIINPVETKLI